MPRRRLTACALALLLGVAASASVLVARQDDHAAAVRQIVESAASATGPGVAVAVVANGTVVVTATRGVADLNRRSSLTTRAVFDLASVSKQFTAMAVMLLAEQGKLALEDDARKFLPELPVFNRARPITVADLLHMVSGLADYLSLVDSTDGVTNEDVLQLVARSKLQFPTGTRYVYSNTDYEMLALIVKRVSGRTYGAYLQAAIFGPLGMSSSVVLERERQVIPGRVTGYVRKRGAWQVDQNDTPTLVGDGNVFSSVEDLALWDRALRRHTLVSASMTQKAFTSGVLNSGKATDYSFGWMIDRAGPRGQVSHDGAWNGTSTYIVRDLGNGYTVIALSNITDFDIAALGDRVLALYQ